MSPAAIVPLIAAVMSDGAGGTVPGSRTPSIVPEVVLVGSAAVKVKFVIHFVDGSLLSCRVVDVIFPGLSIVEPDTRRFSSGTYELVPLVREKAPCPATSASLIGNQLNWRGVS